MAQLLRLSRFQFSRVIHTTVNWKVMGSNLLTTVYVTRLWVEAVGSFGHVKCPVYLTSSFHVDHCLFLLLYTL